MKLSKIFTINPSSIGRGSIGQLANLVDGIWKFSDKTNIVIDPMNGSKMIEYPSEPNINDYINSMKKVPIYGLHNPLLNQQRYLMYGEITQKTANSLDTPIIKNYFIELIQRVMPKSYQQAEAEVEVTKKFLYNFSGDQVRFLAKGMSTPGDHYNQQSHSYRFPYGPTALITPFNFPLEIPVLQMMGSLYMGNKVLVKNCQRTSAVIEQFIRLLHYNGMPLTDVDLIHGEPQYMEKLIKEGLFKNIQFTGSSHVGEKLSKITNGKVKLEDAGLDYKILGPDVYDVNYVAQVSDNDAYNCSGQKCSAQSLLFIHENWLLFDFLDKIEELAKKRNLNDLSIGPVLTWNNKQIKSHIEDVLKISGSKLLFGGKEIQSEIPIQYGSFEPTAIFIPIQSINENNFKLISKELFGPFQIVVSYKNSDEVVSIVNKLPHHLTAAVVSNDPLFYNNILSKTVNGTTYFGNKARTTGAPQNHFFGPGGDPRGAGIGTKEAIQNVWSYHREIIQDF
jgi:1-pyrroline-5-carboxylate dehydrogenase